MFFSTFHTALRCGFLGVANMNKPKPLNPKPKSRVNAGIPHEATFLWMFSIISPMLSLRRNKLKHSCPIQIGERLRNDEPSKLLTLKAKP